ncbi:anti-sigma factor family protein [Stieleria varia]|uniref:Zinc-finger domain-containing protein n=1 Tax=Stieleria varia TaxID=2528005 RepID=A0A5C6ARM6_9BACT|nr:zf-HC2 domain-containing protein [Stieleria varia]TWU02350.1 hypothetical protein Pla52n_34000 [Stieleria varia]
MRNIETLTDEQPVHPDDETLSAYLDGELSNSERTEVENRLIKDESFRKRLQQLQSSWDWLSQLPSEAPSEKLMQSTIELVISDIEPPKKETRSWWGDYRALVLGLLLCLVCFVAAVGVTRELERQRLRAQVSDLTLAENLDALLLGNDFELMRELDASVSWKMMVSTYQDISGQKLLPDVLVASTPVDQRETAIADMTPLERASLESHWKAFRSLDETTEAKVRETARTLSQQPDAETLTQTMKTYARWRESLPAEMRQTLESSEGVARRQAIEAAVAYSLGKLSDDSGSIISDETADRIWFQLQRLLQERLASDDELTEFYERMKQVTGDDRAEMALISMMVFRRMDGRRGRSWNRPPSGGNFVMPRTLSDDDLNDMTVILDDNALQNLNALTNWNPYSGRDPHLVSIAMQAWVEETVRRNAPQRENTETESWIQRYEKSEDRDVLDLLTPAEIKRRLLPQQNWFRRGESSSTQR